MTSEKFLIMALALNVTPPALALPRTVPLVQKEEFIAGMLKWSVPEWKEAEFLRIQREVNNFISTTRNIEIQEYTAKLADKLEELLPDRSFSLSLGSFCIERKVEKEVKK